MGKTLAHAQDQSRQTDDEQMLATQAIGDIEDKQPFGITMHKIPQTAEFSDTKLQNAQRGRRETA
jgi:hypothetical protein